MVIMFNVQDMWYFVEMSPVIIIVLAVFPLYISISLDNITATDIMYNTLRECCQVN
jgi:succinate dehydrogenase hydrophobic anchor subunit